MATILIPFIFIINIVAFYLMRTDKQRSVRRQSRIPEVVLLAIAFFGGSVGIFLGMTAFRHKTQKLLFSVGVPVVFAIQITIILFIKYPGFGQVFGF